ncbi:MAG: hypothetical protein ACJAU9_000423 [Lentimonas sp.]|jgi:hypothetical protein
MESNVENNIHEARGVFLEVKMYTFNLNIGSLFSQVVSQDVANFCALAGDENEAYKELIVTITKWPLCCD